MNFMSELVLNEQQAKRFLEGSFYGSSFEDWCAARSFICRNFIGSGTVLDIGCANGLLLKCLMEWSNYQLTPYGIDHKSKLIQMARKLFVGYDNNFAVLSAKHLAQIEQYGLPRSYTYVFWNVWDQFFFNSEANIKTLHNAYGLVKKNGRLILGFYDNETKNIPIKIQQAAQALGSVPKQFKNLPRREVSICFDQS